MTTLNIPPSNPPANEPPLPPSSKVDEPADAKLNSLNQHWRSRVLDPHAQSSADALSDTLKPVFQVLFEFGPHALDLSNFPSDQAHPLHLAVVLRATLTQKSNVPGWHEALDVARKACARSGVNERSALLGLIERDPSTRPKP